ncbi:ChaB family protein [Leptolyngbya sp. FACHB-711]|jgi:cation transport regulator|uniref:ChaB family protein n=1 Tax=unclassified Leptolyngbya TaxID=2650499 RepID=UPI0016897983|nr:ChaB family protein [Leptolyngbya sp. FACHB-711]MBD1850161.1 ChaB family protein [Cyanobacteria bacterium FACHB-502]MBD2023397.1 ChaB family protein [Leptolyngbya sp. FACHB-711]
MNQLSRESLPQDIKDVLPEEAQGIFVAAYNSFLDNSQDEAAAREVAWQTINNNSRFARGEDGKYVTVDEYDGGHDRPLANMPSS